VYNTNIEITLLGNKRFEEGVRQGKRKAVRKAESVFFFDGIVCFADA
jgi:hypothetical protein